MSQPTNGVREIKVGVSLGLQGCEITGTIEVDEGASSEEIEAEVREWAFGHIEYWSEE